MVVSSILKTQGFLKTSPFENPFKCFFDFNKRQKKKVPSAMAQLIRYTKHLKCFFDFNERQKKKVPSAMAQLIRYTKHHRRKKGNKVSEPSKTAPVASSQQNKKTNKGSKEDAFWKPQKVPKTHVQQGLRRKETSFWMEFFGSPKKVELKTFPCSTALLLKTHKN